MLETLDHVVLVVHDLEKAAETYSALLGLRPSWRGVHPALGTANVLFRLRNTYLELLNPNAEGPGARALRARLDRQGEGLLALAFGTTDVEACARELRRRGLQPSDPKDGEGRDPATDATRRWRTVGFPESETRGIPLFAIEHRTPPDLLPPAEPVEDPPSVVEALDHVVVLTGDPEASRTLYRDRLGIRLALDRTFEERRVRLLFFRIGGVTVELAARLEGAKTGAPDRLWGLSYRVPDVRRARERLVRAGFEVSETRPGHKEGTRVCTVRRETHGVPTLVLGPE